MNKEYSPIWPEMADKFYEGLGWMYAECCASLDRGEDPRKAEVSEMVERCIKDLTRDDDHKEGFVPEIGQSVQCKDSPDISGKVLFVGKKHALLEDDDGEEWAIYIDHLEPVKSEAQKRRHEQIEKISNYLASLGDNHLTPKSDFVFKRIQDLESETMRMSYNDGPAKGVIRDLYRVVDQDDGAECLAVALYNARCRMTRELDDVALVKLMTDHHIVSDTKIQDFAEAIAAYVTGGGEL